MQELDFDRLRPIGLSPAMARAIAVVREDASGAPLRVTEVHRETLRVHDGVAEFTARVMPRLQRRLVDDGDALAVGDWVLAECDRHGDWWAHTRIAPQSQLARRDMHGRPQVFASNVDTALLVMGVDADFSPRRLERVIECAAQVPALHPRLEAWTRVSPAMARVTAVNLGNASLSEIGTQS